MCLNFLEKSSDKHYTAWTIYTLLEKVTALSLHSPLPCPPPQEIKKPSEYIEQWGGGLL